MSFRILYQDDFFVAIDKPAGFHVHPPEDPSHSISQATNCLYLLGRQLGLYLYPVHRLDRATSGVLLFALQKSSARSLCQSFAQQTVKKTYVCVTRGWTQENGLIDRPLKGEETEVPSPSLYQEATTAFKKIAHVEIPQKVGRYPTARYSLLQVEPRSGRKHQIRRHLEHISHPLVGDTIYGRGEHNRFFKETLDIQGLLLKAYSIELNHPDTGNPIRIISRWNGLWHRVFDIFKVCPYLPQQISHSI